ncbi:MAG: DUF4249 family protein [Bacteroidota bacterium]
MKRIIKYLCLLCLSFFACEEYREWELETTAENFLVVEAILTDENIRQQIKLSQSFADINGTVPPVTDADILVEVNGVQYIFSHNEAEPGSYLSDQAFDVKNNLIYTLEIFWQGERFAAQSELSNVSPIPTFGFEENGDTDSLVFSRFVHVFNPNQQAMYEMNIDWSHLSNEPNSRALQYFYTFNSVHIGQFVFPAREKVRFPRGSIVEVKKFGLNDDFAEFLRAMALETEWSGVVYYATPDNVQGNISNGALGFFTTCAILRDTLIAE